MMNLIVACIAAFSVLDNCVAYSSRPAGVYVDNGYDQTKIERVMSRQDKREMELEILNLLGLPNRPNRRYANGTLKRAAPRFLMDIYKSLLTEDEDGQKRARRSTDELNLSGDEINAIDESDVIMTFESISKERICCYRRFR